MLPPRLLRVRGAPLTSEYRMGAPRGLEQAAWEALPACVGPVRGACPHTFTGVLRPWLPGLGR